MNSLPPQSEESPPTDGLYEIPDGTAGVRAVINHMSRLTRAYKKNPDIVRLARQLVQHVEEKNPWEEAAAIQNWVRNNIRYVGDVFDVETLSTPDETLRQRAGDCDDKSLLVGTLLQAIGYPVRYVAWAYEAPGAFEHVYAEVHIGRNWIGVETTEPCNLGWVPQSEFRPIVANV